MAEATNETVLDAQRAYFAELGIWPGFQCWADALVQLQYEDGGRGGCPIANLVGQLGERDDDTRAVLASGLDRWEAHIRTGLAAMVRAGKLRADTDIDWLVASTLASVQGGLLLTQARRDVGCARAMEILHAYVDLVIADPPTAVNRYPGVVAHLSACGPCGEDFDGLLAAVTSDRGRHPAAVGAALPLGPCRCEAAGVDPHGGG